MPLLLNQEKADPSLAKASGAQKPRSALGMTTGRALAASQNRRGAKDTLRPACLQPASCGRQARRN